MLLLPGFGFVFNLESSKILHVTVSVALRVREISIIYAKTIIIYIYTWEYVPQNSVRLTSY